MKKRVLSAALSLCMLLTLLPTAALATGDEESTTPGTSPASKTLQEEINTAEKGATVSLSKNETGNITVSADKDITLDLAGYKLTNTADSHTVTVEKGATLTVMDSSKAKTGTIDNTSHQKGAVVNNGTFVLNSGNLTRSREASKYDEEKKSDIANGNSWYVVLNHGTMTVNGGKVFFSESNIGYFSSLIANGWYTGLENTEEAPASLTITDGEFTGGKITIKNDDYGVLNIRVGTFSQSDARHFCIYSCNDATISGGTINGTVGCGGYEQEDQSSYEQGKLVISGDTQVKGGIQTFDNANVSISGGTFTNTYLYVGANTANISVTGGSFTKAENRTTGLVFQAKNTNGTCAISGGTFSENPGAEYLKPGLSATQTEEGGTFSITPAAVKTVYPAILADQASEGAIDAKDLCSDYKVEAALKQEADTGDYYNEVAISAKNLKKHTNANSTKGHWIGIALVAPNGAQKMKYAFAASKAELSLGQAGALETNVTDKNESGIAFYVDAGSKTPKTWAQVQWLDKDGAVLSNTVYHMDLSGVTLAMDEDTMPKIRPAKLHDNAETNAYKDEDLYTAGSYDAKITSQGAGGVYNVAITAQQLRKHTNAKKDKDYWVGFDLEAPEGVTKFKYAFDATISETAKEENVETLPGNKTGVAFYFKDKTAKTVTVQWVAEGEGDDATTYTFSVDLSGVAYYQAPSHGGSGSSGGSASTTYTLTFETNGGSAISKVTKNKGTNIDLAQYAPTKSGATFEGWYADKGLTQKITSVKLDANTTVYAKWTEAPVSGLPFGDVKSADWFYNDVKYVYEKGMMAGTAADVFAPNATTTRAMIVTILYRLEGSPAVTGTSAFVDVPAGQWYTDAVNWAAANQIVKGTSATTFAPNDSITREQMAAILYRYAQYKGYDVTKKADLSGYSDNGQVSAYAKDALAWANAAKLINGVTNTTLAPQGNATRAQVSAILHRFCDGVVK